jgi:hypothetical protein
MSENCRFYAQKMAERRARLESSVNLRRQLNDLLRTVQHCEAMWALEDRMESFGERRPDNR